MILRKPYAFFIKYFRLLNLIIAVLMGFLIYRTGVLANFLREYSTDYNIINNGFVLGDYISFYSFLMVLVIIILNIIIISVLFIKGKPKKLYIFNLLIYIGVMVLYAVDYSVLRSALDNILDFRVSQGLRDVSFIVLGIQVVSCIYTLVRATGFDIKSFDFQSDLDKLDISEEDSEEFEVALEFDKNKTKREIRRNFRHFKYVYFEHKFVINLGVIIFAVLMAFIVFMNVGVYTANYDQGETFTASSLSANVKNSYITTTDYDNNVIQEGKALVVVKLDVRSLSEGKKTLNTGLITLRIGNDSYGQTTKYIYEVSDLGTSYVGQNLSTGFESYLLVFEIPEELQNKNMVLKFNDNVSYVRGQMGAKSIYVKLEPMDLTVVEDTAEVKFNETLSFDGSILGDTVLNISSIAIGSKFKVSYDFCSKVDRCFESYEYVTPTATGSYPKTLMRIESDYEVDESQNLGELNDVFYLINGFATFHYQIGDKWYAHKVDSEFVRPKIGSDVGTYIEVNKQAESATAMYLTFNVRNYSYKYNLK